MKFQKGVSHFKSLVFLVSCYDRAKFHHHFLQLSREFQHPRSSRAEETREESREKITVILGGWEKEGPSILRPSPDFWQHDRFASYSRRRFRRVTGIGDHVAGITFLRPTLFSNRGERARSALFATFSPIPEFLPRHRLSISYPSCSPGRTTFFETKSMKICCEIIVKFITKRRDGYFSKSCQNFRRQRWKGIEVEKGKWRQELNFFWMYSLSKHAWNTSINISISFIS